MNERLSLYSKPGCRQTKEIAKIAGGLSRNLLVTYAFQFGQAPDRVNCVARLVAADFSIGRRRQIRSVGFHQNPFQRNPFRTGPNVVRSTKRKHSSVRHMETTLDRLEGLFLVADKAMQETTLFA